MRTERSLVLSPATARLPALVATPCCRAGSSEGRALSWDRSRLPDTPDPLDTPRCWCMSAEPESR